MVYPPPPPNMTDDPRGSLPTTPQNQDNFEYNRPSYSLPSMGSWAPPPFPSPRSAAVRGFEDPLRTHSSGRSTPLPIPSRPSSNHEPMWNRHLSREQRLNPPKPASETPRPQKRSREDEEGVSRRPSDADEVEAGLALAGLGLGLTAGQVKQRRDSMSGKKVKLEMKALEKKGEAKDQKKSCAECRRLKAKCDRQFPCSNCRRRGCALVCPEGDLSCMQGKRLVLASTEKLHERISQLESALAKDNAHHPLLAAEYLDGGFATMPTPSTMSTPRFDDYPPRPQTSSSRPSQSSVHRSSTESFLLATPHLSAEGRGRMAVQSLLLNDDQAAMEGRREDEWVGENAAPAMIVGTVGSSPRNKGEKHILADRLRSILRVLPSRERTKKCLERFHTQAGWFNTILHREDIDIIYEPAVFEPTSQNPITPHKLGCILIALTIESYLNLSGDDESAQVAGYWEATQRCFDTRFGWAASVAGVQALTLAALFVGLGWKGSSASNFYWMRLATSAVQQLGLHKEPHHSLPESEKEFRRRVFYECFVIDGMISMNHGQRSGISAESIEARIPKLSGETAERQLRRYGYTRNVVHPIIEIGCRPDTAPASWTEVIEADARLSRSNAENNPAIHPAALYGAPSPLMHEDNFDLNAMVKCTGSLCHYKCTLFLYRPTLRRLIGRLRTNNTTTFNFSDEDRKTIAETFKACQAMIIAATYQARAFPKLSARCWTVWVQTFSAAVSLATIVIWCGPHLEPDFVSSVYQELNKACDLFKEHGFKRPTGVMTLIPIIHNLVANRYPQLNQRPSTLSNQSTQEGEDMLFALLGGTIDRPSTPSCISLSSIDPRTPNTMPIPAPYLNLQEWHTTDGQQMMGFSAFPMMPMVSGGGGGGAGVVGKMGLDMTENEVWASLQSSYEPVWVDSASGEGWEGMGMGNGMGIC